MSNKNSIQPTSLQTESFQSISPNTSKTVRTSKKGDNTVATRTVRPPKNLLYTMFENQTGEWEFVASDGKVFRFHQCVLEEQIEYFRALFSHQETVECQNKRLVAPPEVNLPGPALEAFLRYVYYKDTAGMAFSFSITSALARAGHYYIIPSLVKLAAEKIKWFSKSYERAVWFNVKELWEFYQHVWLWEEAHPSKRRLVQSIVRAMMRFANNKEDRHELLELTNGNQVLRDLLVAFGNYIDSSSDSD